MARKKTKQPAVWLADEEKAVPFAEALKILTDENIDAGHYCAQTVIDLVAVCKWLAGRAAAVGLEIAPDERGTRSQQRVDGRAGRRDSVEERTRWAVVVEEEEEEMASEFRSVKTDAEGACREARTLRDVLEKRGRRGVVAAVEVVERRRIVEVFEIGSSIDPSSATLGGSK